MLNIAICDDNPEQLAHLNKSCEGYLSAKKITDANICQYNNALEFLNAISGIERYDIVLLDIFMPGVTGIQLAREMRRRKLDSAIVFFTTSEDFALEAFSVKASHYIVKPFTQNDFNEALDRAMQHLSTANGAEVALKSRNGEIYSVDVNDILYIENSLHSQIITLKNGKKLEARQSMAELATLLEDVAFGQFISPYKGVIINFKEVRQITPAGVIMRGEKLLPIVKRNFRALREQYFRFMFQSSASTV